MLNLLKRLDKAIKCEWCKEKITKYYVTSKGEKVCESCVNK